MLSNISSPQWEAIIPEYDTFFVDLVGVVHDGIHPFPEAIEALNLLGTDKNLVFVSNNPRPSELSIKKLESYQLKPSFTVVTSGDFARANLLLDKNSIYYHWGAITNADILEGVHINLTDDINNANKILLTAFIESDADDTQFDLLIDQIIKRKLPVFCANPDRYAFHGQELRKCAGYFAEKVKKWGGDVTLWGKPNVEFYNFVENQFPIPHFDKTKCLMIGDTLETDILGAHQYGIDSLLVLSGVSEALRKTQSLTLEQLTREINPTYILNKLGG